MSKHLFNTLASELCKNLGLKKPEQVINGGGITFNEVHFSLGYNETYCPYSIYVYCDYGEASRHVEATIYESLLKENDLRAKEQLPIFALAPETGRVTSMYRFDVSSINAAQLLEQMTFMADAVKEWKALDWSAQSLALSAKNM